MITHIEGGAMIQAVLVDRIVNAIEQEIRRLHGDKGSIIQSAGKAKADAIRVALRSASDGYYSQGEPAVDSLSSFLKYKKTETAHSILTAAKISRGKGIKTGKTLAFNKIMDPAHLTAMYLLGDELSKTSLKELNEYAPDYESFDRIFSEEWLNNLLGETNSDWLAPHKKILQTKNRKIFFEKVKQEAKGLLSEKKIEIKRFAMITIKDKMADVKELVAESCEQPSDFRALCKEVLILENEIRELAEANEFPLDQLKTHTKVPYADFQQAIDEKIIQQRETLHHSHCDYIDGISGQISTLLRGIEHSGPEEITEMVAQAKALIEPLSEQNLGDHGDVEQYRHEVIEIISSKFSFVTPDSLSEAKQDILHEIAITENTRRVQYDIDVLSESMETTNAKLQTLIGQLDLMPKGSSKEKETSVLRSDIEAFETQLQILAAVEIPIAHRAPKIVIKALKTLSKEKDQPDVLTTYREKRTANETAIDTLSDLVSSARRDIHKKLFKAQKTVKARAVVEQQLRGLNASYETLLNSSTVTAFVENESNYQRSLRSFEKANPAEHIKMKETLSAKHQALDVQKAALIKDEARSLVKSPLATLSTLTNALQGVAQSEATKLIRSAQVKLTAQFTQIYTIKHGSPYEVERLNAVRDAYNEQVVNKEFKIDSKDYRYPKQLVTALHKATSAYTNDLLLGHIKQSIAGAYVGDVETTQDAGELSDGIGTIKSSKPSIRRLSPKLKDEARSVYATRLNELKGGIESIIHEEINLLQLIFTDEEESVNDINQAYINVLDGPLKELEQRIARLEINPGPKTALKTRLAIKKDALNEVRLQALNSFLERDINSLVAPVLTVGDHTVNDIENVYENLLNETLAGIGGQIDRFFPEDDDRKPVLHALVDDKKTELKIARQQALDAHPTAAILHALTSYKVSRERDGRSHFGSVFFKQRSYNSKDTKVNAAEKAIRFIQGDSEVTLSKDEKKALRSEGLGKIATSSVGKRFLAELLAKAPEANNQNTLGR